MQRDDQVVVARLGGAAFRSALEEPSYMNIPTRRHKPLQFCKTNAQRQFFAAEHQESAILAETEVSCILTKNIDQEFACDNFAIQVNQRLFLGLFGICSTHTPQHIMENSLRSALLHKTHDVAMTILYYGRSMPRIHSLESAR